MFFNCESGKVHPTIHIYISCAILCHTAKETKETKETWTSTKSSFINLIDKQ